MWPCWLSKTELCSGFQGLCYTLPGRATPALTWVSVCCHETTTPGAVLHKKTSTDAVLKACCTNRLKALPNHSCTAVKRNLINCDFLYGQSHLKPCWGLSSTGIFQLHQVQTCWKPLFKFAEPNLSHPIQPVTSIWETPEQDRHLARQQCPAPGSLPEG